jgi:hypothetical protein
MPSEHFIETVERSKLSLSNLPEGLSAIHKAFIAKIAVENYNLGFREGLKHNLKTLKTPN